MDLVVSDSVLQITVSSFNMSCNLGQKLEIDALSGQGGRNIAECNTGWVYDGGAPWTLVRDNIELLDPR